MAGGEVIAGALGSTVVEYGSFLFSEYTTTKLTVVPLPSGDGVTTYQDEYELTVDSFVSSTFLLSHSSGSNDLDMNSLRVYLLAPNRSLRLAASGYGEIEKVVNSTRAGTLGAIPVDCMIENLGNGQTSRIVWKVRFTLPRITGQFVTNREMAWYTHEVDYSISDRGRLSQIVRISGQHNYGFYHTGGSNYTSGIGTLPDFLNNIIGIFHIDINFSHRSWTLNISPDRKNFVLTITDDQIDSDVVYPRGVEHMDITHRVNSTLEKGFQLWTNSIEGTIRLYPGYDKMLAWFVYRVFFVDRYNRGIQQIRETRGYSRISRIQWPRIQSIEIVDKLVGVHELGFRVQYDLNVNSVADIFARTGILTTPNPVDNDTNWAAGAPVRNEPAFLYGNARRRLKDIPHSLITQAGTKAFLRIDGQVQQFSSTFSPQQSIAQVDCPEMMDSWKDYQIVLTFTNSRQIARHERYGATTAAREISTQPSLKYEVRFDAATERENRPNLFTIYGTASQQVRMKGYAVRFGGATDPPQISSIGGKPVRLQHEEISHQIISSSICPMHVTKWDKLYWIDGQIASGASLLDNMDQGVAPERYQHG